MNRVGEAAIILAIACIGVANMIGSTMSRLAQQKTGHSYWPPAANTRLARDYREHLGPDRNYVYYGILHFATLGLMLLAVVVSALSS